MPVIEVAERAAPRPHQFDQRSEDRIVVLPHAAVLLDGATTLVPSRHSGGWYAERLADALRARLSDRPDGALTELLADAIAGVAGIYGLCAGDSPSSTAAIVRWTESTVDALVLADSPVVAFTTKGTEILSDHRLAELPAIRRNNHRSHLRQGGGFNEQHRELLRASAIEVGAWRNRVGGFWVAEADPSAATQALTASWPRETVRTIIMASDGVSCGVDDYELYPDWSELLRHAEQEGAQAVLNNIRVAESTDADGRRWPRPKPYDDQSMVLIDFTG